MEWHYPTLNLNRTLLIGSHFLHQTLLMVFGCPWSEVTALSVAFICSLSSGVQQFESLHPCHPLRQLFVALLVAGDT